MDQTPRYQDEIDWKDLLRYPSRLFGYSYLYFLTAIVALGLLYFRNINATGRNAIAPQVLTDSTAFVLDIPLQMPRVLPPVDVMKAGVSSPELVSRGGELFKANCSSCHGDNGQGDGPTAPTLDPKPRNFHSLDGWKNGSKVTQMYKTLQEGVPGSAMASYNYMPPEDRFALIHYVRTFAQGHPQDTPEELKLLDATYQLSTGMNIPGQMPIKKAMQLVVMESSPLVEKLHAEVATIAASNDQGATLLRHVAGDEQKVLASAVHAKQAALNVDEFIKIVTADPVQAGFKASVVDLSAAEWSTLYQYLMNIVKEG